MQNGEKYTVYMNFTVCDLLCKSSKMCTMSLSPKQLKNVFVVNLAVKLFYVAC